MEKFISIEDAAKSLYLDTASLIRKSVEDNLPLVVNMDENPSKLPVNFHFSQSKESLHQWLEGSPLNQHSHSMLSDFSGFEQPTRKTSLLDDDIAFDDDNIDGWNNTDVIKAQLELDYIKSINYLNGKKASSILGYMKGSWILNQRYLKSCISQRIFPMLNLNHLMPYGTLYNVNFLSINSLDNTFNSDYSLYISTNDFNYLYDSILDGKVIKKSRNYSYESQGNAQKERHAAKRESVLMAAISIYKRFPNDCSKSSSRWAAMLWKHSNEYWKDSPPPLSQDEIVKLLRKASKAP